jgi:hypothetical protein
MSEKYVLVYVVSIHVIHWLKLGNGKKCGQEERRRYQYLSRSRWWSQVAYRTPPQHIYKNRHGNLIIRIQKFLIASQRRASKLFFKSTNRKSANSWAHSAIAILKFLSFASPQIENPLIFMIIRKSKICKFPHNTAELCIKVVLKFVFGNVFMQKFELEHSCYICKEKKYLDLRNFRSGNHKKNGPANSKSAKCHICGRSANLTSYLSPQMWGITICETYLRTTHLPHLRLYTVGGYNDIFSQPVLTVNKIAHERIICQYLWHLEQLSFDKGKKVSISDTVIGNPCIKIEKRKLRQE